MLFLLPSAVLVLCSGTCGSGRRATRGRIERGDVSAFVSSARFDFQLCSLVCFRARACNHSHNAMQHGLGCDVVPRRVSFYCTALQTSSFFEHVCLFLAHSMSDPWNGSLRSVIQRCGQSCGAVCVLAPSTIGSSEVTVGRSFFFTMKPCLSIRHAFAMGPQCKVGHNWHPREF
jgi:hypothetical protein